MDGRTSLLRRRLFTLAAAALLPIAVTTGLGFWTSLVQQRKEAARAGIELTRALATAVDAELQRSVSVVRAVATSPTLDADDLAAFHRRAIRVVAAEPFWHAVELFDANGVRRVDTRFPLGVRDAGDPATETTDLRRVRETLAPTIGNLRPNDDGKGARYLFSVQVPIVRDGSLRYVLVALVEPEAILGILERQRVPSAWVISIFDAAGQRVARSRAHEVNLAKPGSPSVVALMAGPGDEGWGRTNAVEGDPMYTAYSRAKAFDWTVATGIPLADVDGATWHSALVLGSGFVLSIVIGVIAATLVGRSITGPMRGLERAATALGRREQPAIPATPILEIQRVGAALAEAALERARGERERDRLLARAQEARAEAEAANRAKDEFLAMLGHELRNPLGAVANAVALLDHPHVTPEAAAHGRQIIARQTAHLARMTDDLLDAGRVITGKIVLDRGPLDLAEVVVRALATVDTRRHRVVRELAWVWIVGDPTRLEQIVVNLVGNAVKYTPEGGTITVCVGREGADGVLRVRDDGIGMSPELVGRVFELFVQGDRGLDRAAGGLGIGLTLVRRLAELHGGNVSAVSAGAGRGSELIVRIPAIAAPATWPRPAAAAPLATGVATGRDVLVVEDNEDARIALCELLELAGHRVRSECDGTAGLATALAAPPEVALIDVGLPGMDGYEVARRIRARESGARRTTLVALTGYGLPEDRQRALDAGFDVHLVKPVNLTALTEVLAT